MFFAVATAAFATSGMSQSSVDGIVMSIVIGALLIAVIALPILAGRLRARMEL